MSAITMEREAVSLSDRAARRVARILTKENPGTVLRISVSGGGCSGFQYEYNLVPDDRTDEDLVLERDGARVLIDSLSLEFMTGSEIDFVDDLIGQSFQIKNPNAVASCGCGTSFAI
jgi:iron-sulfur cluster assembly accessory protein